MRFITSQNPLKVPFFIIGCVRSGTTMLRNVLRLHPNLAAPEETHFYRWSEPFGTDASLKQLAKNTTLTRHRAIDGVTEEEFALMLSESHSRRDLYQRYMSLFLGRTKPGAVRWFDKTPQNVYGSAMLAADFPRSRFVHIVRNPLDVVLSLRAGEVMKVSGLIGASNYWLESVTNLHTLKKAFPRRVMEFRYDEFNADPPGHATRVLDFVGEPLVPGFMDAFVSRPKSYDHKERLNSAELATVRRICGKWANAYGYEI
jgi:hypothetical protein